MKTAVLQNFQRPPVQNPPARSRIGVVDQRLNLVGNLGKRSISAAFAVCRAVKDSNLKGLLTVNVGAFSMQNNNKMRLRAATLDVLTNG